MTEKRNEYNGQRLVEVLDFWFEEDTKSRKELIIWFKNFSSGTWVGIFRTV